MLVYVTEPDEIDAEALELLASHGHTILIAPEEAQAHSNEIEVLFVRTYTQVTDAMLEQYSKLKYVLRAGVGLDNIDRAACERRSIHIINAPGANAHAVAEYVVGTLLMSMRHVGAQSAVLRAGGWREPALVGSELRGKVLGLVGCGNVGALIARKLAGWELKEIIGYDPYLTAEQLNASGIRKVELDEVLTNADIVSLHVPLVPETKHLINEMALAKMKQGSVLINAARGGVVDEAALVAALKSKHLRGAVLDVFETEPAISAELIACENLILTPHIAGYTTEANKEISLAPVRELLRIESI